MSNEIDKTKVTYLKDYQVADYTINKVALTFELKEKNTLVEATLSIQQHPQSHHQNAPLILHGEALVLKALFLDGEPLASNRYQVNERQLIIESVPEQFELKIQTQIEPQDNTSLSGLYQSNQLFCTQCEAEGFRKITYYLDRPDNLAIFTTTIIADKAQYPMLLSNGNLIDSGDYPNGQHWVKWHDPFNKPSYLFALVAGNLYCHRDEYTTLAGQKITLEIYVEAQNKSKTAHAMASLKKSMRWDEQVFGLAYDLERYMIVAVDDFNMGAMENKGLNVFNSKYVLADIKSATDLDYEGIESVIGHEYFHNWTGNRVTCRDWFQLSLKEGLTVFREQRFSADCGRAVVKRIQDVKHIRSKQFAEDAGPLSHPIRPEQYIEINNFYTMTVYYKGAEVIRMLHTLVGEAGFKKGMALYFERHDGSAATTDDFVAAMADANNEDLSQFKRWYYQAGTPIVTVVDHYDEDKGVYTVKISQQTPETADKSSKEPFVLPIRMAVLNESGQVIVPTQILVLSESTQTYQFNVQAKRCLPSILGHFSAPVKLQYSRTFEDDIFMMVHDPDLFNRWDAAQTIYTKLIIDLYEARITEIPSEVMTGLKAALSKTTDKGLLAEMLVLPEFDYLLALLSKVDPIKLTHAINHLKNTIAVTLVDEFKVIYDAHHVPNQDLEPDAIDSRQLKNTALYYLMQADADQFGPLCQRQYETAMNMTDKMGALVAVNAIDCDLRNDLLAHFYEAWQSVPLVVNKWLGLHAQSQCPNGVERVRALTTQPGFSFENPNSVYALIRGFACNPNGFHDASGVGYAFLAEMVIKLNQLNPQVAARVLEPLTQWRQFTAHHADQMKAALHKIIVEKQLSKDVYELTYKSIHHE